MGRSHAEGLGWARARHLVIAVSVGPNFPPRSASAFCPTEHLIPCELVLVPRPEKKPKGTVAGALGELDQCFPLCGYPVYHVDRQVDGDGTLSGLPPSVDQSFLKQDYPFHGAIARSEKREPATAGALSPAKIGRALWGSAPLASHSRHGQTFSANHFLRVMSKNL